MTRIKSTLVLSSLCANYRRLQDPLSIRHIQKKPNQGHGRTPTWRKVTTERISLSADQTQALLHVKITVLDLFYPAGCWPGLTPPPHPAPCIYNELSKPKQSPAQVQSSSGLVPGEGVDTLKEKVYLCYYLVLFLSLGASAGPKATWALSCPAPPLQPGTVRGNSTSKRSPAGAGGTGDSGGGDAAHPRPRCHVPRHDAHVVQKHVGGEWVNRKKKGTAALLLKI